MSASDPKKDQVKRSLERLLAGERGIEHIHRLFLWLRTRSHGHASIREVGDSIAHFDQRDRGALVDRVLDFLGRKKAKAAAYRALGKLDRKLNVIGFPSEQETTCFNFFTGSVTNETLIEHKQFNEDLFECLKRNDLIDSECRGKLNALATHVILYLITQLHQTPLVFKDQGPKAELTAGIYADYKDEDPPVVALYVYALAKEEPPIWVGYPIIITLCKPTDYCTAEMAEASIHEHGWKRPLEIGEDGLLRFVVL